MSTRTRSLVAVVAIAASLVACAQPVENDDGDNTPSRGGRRGGGEDTEEPTGPTDSPTPSEEEPPATPPPAPAAAPLIYAHTATALYTFEAGEKKLTQVGTLNCLPAKDRLLDIAVDADGKMYGTTDQAFVAINPTDATCTRIVAKTGLPNSLSFVPAGTLDATSDALVGYAFDASSKAVRYVRINTSDGTMTDVGTLNPPTATKKYVSSGDVFSVAAEGNKTYLTVREDGAAATAPDMLAEIDPKTGTIKAVVGNTLQARIYGLAYWGGKAYGFSDDGNVSEINVANGVSNVVTTLKDAADVPVPWFGAGVTTEAPTR